MSNFGNRLKQLRKSYNLKQRDLARKLNLSQTTIANYEHNSRFPDRETLIAIADLFKVSLDYLLARSDIRIDLSENFMHKYSLDPATPYDSLYNRYLELLLAFKKNGAEELIIKSVNKGICFKKIFLSVFTPTLRRSGELWETEVITTGHVRYITMITRNLIRKIGPEPFNSAEDRHKIMAVPIKGETHTVGLEMIAYFFVNSGWETYFFDTGLAVRHLISLTRNIKPDILAVSSAISYNINSVANLITAVKEESDLNCKIIVGGNIFNYNRHLWQKINADGYAADARQAIEVAEKLINDK